MFSMAESKSFDSLSGDLPQPPEQNKTIASTTTRVIALFMVQKVCPFSAHQRNDRLMPSSSATVGL